MYNLIQLYMFHAIGLRFHCFTMLLNLWTWLVIEDGCATAHSPTLLSLLLSHKLFTCISWRGAHGTEHSKTETFKKATFLKLLKLYLTKTRLKLLANNIKTFIPNSENFLNNGYLHRNQSWVKDNQCCQAFSTCL